MIGRSAMIVTLGVPDLWIAYVTDVSVPYVYTTDKAFVDELMASGTVQLGFYKFGALETQKVDLTNYYTKPQVDNLLPKEINESVYNEQFNSGTLPVGQYMIRLGV